MEGLDENLMIAPCGVNCGVCLANLRETSRCPGCRVADPSKPKTRLACKIKTCETFKETKAKFCFECEKFPCNTVKRLDKRYRTRYNMSPIENLEFIRDLGIKQFMKNEGTKWSCPNCGGVICVHKGRCFRCGMPKATPSA